jgi:hypothetical protein
MQVGGEFTRFYVVSFSRGTRELIEKKSVIERVYHTWREDDGLLYIVYQNRIRDVYPKSLLLQCLLALLLLIPLIVFLYYKAFLE